jgi:hypothetical protein
MTRRLPVGPLLTGLLAVFLLTLLLASAWAQVKKESEPNNSSNQANDIRLGETMEGFFQEDQDEDYYKLIVDKPGKNCIEVDLSGVPGVDSRLQIIDKDEHVLWDVNDGAEGEPESVKYFTVTEGTYYIWIKCDHKNTTNKYALSTRLLGPCEPNQEAEPNDNAKSANEIKLNVPIMGRINRSDDVDYYVLKVPEPGLDLFLSRVSGVPGVSWYFELLDADENSLAISKWAEAGEGEEITRMKFKPGTYYLKAQIQTGKNVGGQYTLYAGKSQKPPATAEEVRQALIRALDFLAAKQAGGELGTNWEEAYNGLCLMSFIGAKCVQKDYSANINGAVKYLKSKYTPSTGYAGGSKEAAYYGGQLGSDNMYEHAIGTLALIEALVDLNDPSLEPIIQDALNLIIRAQNTEHKPDVLGGPVQPDKPVYGGWRYQPDSTDSDLSVTGWQILALKAAVNAGFSVPDFIFASAAKFVRSLQGREDGSFSYNAPGDRGDSCARAGMGALSLYLCGSPRDPMISPALRFMQDFPPHWNVEVRGNGYPFYYWYYGTRAMYLSGGDDWRIWEDWMCRFLVDHQKADGTWDGSDEESTSAKEIYRTALGALMLEFCCGHVPVYMSSVKRLEPALIRVDFEKGAERETTKNVEIIMDASNSMTGLIGRETKIAVARRVLTQIISGLPGTMSVGLRVYGHRFATDDYKNACQDTELLVPIGPVDKTRLLDMVNKIQTKGRTPLVLSVLEAIKDFEKIPTGSIILVTDGIESCNGDIKSIGPAIKKAGLELKVHIVGFDIKEAEARKELEAIAKSTEGMYLDAKDAVSLLSALEQTLQVEYQVLDEKGQVAARGTVGGDPVKIKEGAYTLKIMLAPQPLEMKVTIKSGEKPVYVLRKEAGKWIFK